MATSIEQNRRARLINALAREVGRKEAWKVEEQCAASYPGDFDAQNLCLSRHTSRIRQEPKKKRP